MEDKQKKYLDKVIEFLLRDTIIDYDNTTIQLVGSDLEYDIEFIHDKFFKIVWDVLEDNYGLNGDEIVYVLGNYLYQINKKIILHGSINESVDSKKERYLNKVVEFLLRDTVIDLYNKDIKFPSHKFLSSFNSNSVYYMLTFTYPPDNFSKYIKDTYGLTEEEIDYVWNIYIPIIKEKINR